jgi:hypothetical protein
MDAFALLFAKQSNVHAVKLFVFVNAALCAFMPKAQRSNL